ncbi:MAG: peptidase M48, partial [Alphaproteobacteria bacterium]|nr:peptidase M48 [Alphaproteobacteria bacterium]
MAAYVQQLGQNLARHSELPDLAFTFTVLNSPVVNARALPGGYIYVTRGLLALASDEAELAGVLAHEIGHVTARHAAQRHSQSVAASVGTGLLGILIGNLADLAQLGAAAVLQSYSRDQEFKADELGVRYLTRAGYDPRAMASFLAKLLEDTRIAGEAAGRSGDPDRVDLFASHPRTLDRVERALAEATERPGTGARRNRHEYLGHIEGLIYGDDPKQGFVRGRVFAHPELRIRFEIPPGFRLHNTERQVQALGPDGAKITLSMARRNGGESARDFLLGVTARRLILNDVENLSIDGLDAATTTSSLRGSTGPMDVRLVNIRGDESVYYVF